MKTSNGYNSGMGQMPTEQSRRMNKGKVEMSVELSVMGNSNVSTQRVM